MKFKIGDKVYIKRKKNNDTGVSREIDTGYIKKSVTNNSYSVWSKNENDYIGIFDSCELEKFIEPKFKVGKKVVVEDQNHNPRLMEIVSVKLNKKLKTYVNLLYAVDDGSFVASTDERLLAEMNNANKKFGKRKMKLSEVEKLLGYKIEILK